MMHYHLIVLLLPVMGALAAIRCFSGQETFPGQGIPYIPGNTNSPYSVNCPMADFCFNSYVKRHLNGDESYTITKSCGEPGKCFEEGCEGPSDERNCCCVGNLCNSTGSPTIGLLLLLLTTFRIL
uniref:UPAR/Ly6 domain-containing protein n=1 Tax=Angiostrongylus cantonensis TaxID=6313 RepID=A0A0K0D4C3_ANGCA